MCEWQCVGASALILHIDRRCILLRGCLNMSNRCTKHSPHRSLRMCVTWCARNMRATANMKAKNKQFWPILYDYRIWPLQVYKFWMSITHHPTPHIWLMLLLTADLRTQFSFYWLALIELQKISSISIKIRWHRLLLYARKRVTVKWNIRNTRTPFRV